jgi:hypothetical protein
MSDKIDLLLRDLRSARSGSTLPSPEQSKTLVMPVDEDFRRDDPGGILPGIENGSEATQEEPVRGLDPKPRRGSGGDLQLLSEEQVFETNLSCWPIE